MNLNTLVRGENQADYYARTYWTCPQWTGEFASPPKCVMVFKSNKEKHDPMIKPDKIITVGEARRYLDLLEPESN